MVIIHNANNKKKPTLKNRLPSSRGILWGERLVDALDVIHLGVIAVLVWLRAVFDL